MVVQDEGQSTARMAAGQGASNKGFHGMLTEIGKQQVPAAM